MTAHTLDALLERLSDGKRFTTEPIVEAIRAAFHAVSTPQTMSGAYAIGLDAVHRMPSTATPYEKGVACGIAMMLETESTVLS